MARHTIILAGVIDLMGNFIVHLTVGLALCELAIQGIYRVTF